MKESKSKQRILFAGGGTLGSITPLVGLYEYLRSKDEYQDARFAWIGTRKGPEWNVINPYPIVKIKIFSGKLRRYLSIWNFIDPVFIFFGFMQALYHMMRFRPTIVINAGSYVGVCAVWSAWLWGIPAVLLQLDIRPTLSNIITLLHAKKICASCVDAAKKFPKDRTIVTGIPVRESVLDAAKEIRETGALARLKSQYGIYDTLPVILVSGGGTGAEFLNIRAKELAARFQGVMHIMHITGEGKGGDSNLSENTYHRFSFVSDFGRLAACSDIVITRAGMGTLSELSALGKPAILVPIPASHQEENAVFCDRERAALYLNQERATLENMEHIVCQLLGDTERMRELGQNLKKLFPQDAAARIAAIL